GTDNNQLYRLVKEKEKGNQFIWLHPTWNNNTYAMASWPAFAMKHQVATLSDLAGLYKKKDGRIETFVNFEFSIRPDGLSALEKFYGFEVAKKTLKAGTPGASLIALREHKTEIAMVFGTDASIAKHGWHVFRDDGSFFPPYDLTPYVRKDVLDKYPEMADIINELVATFPGGGKPASPVIVAECQGVWRQLNAKVDIERMEPGEVAEKYLIEEGLIKR
ncbi:MAG: glycine betaine ABC transporter substrate-binding protein, partial [Thermodesulfobacteriota bacterium]|nr:glycine betaine ABC transporter substrate-binding protein [Thermodesulfobacteriota bacterium]